MLVTGDCHSQAGTRQNSVHPHPEMVLKIDGAAAASERRGEEVDAEPTQQDLRGKMMIGSVLRRNGRGFRAPQRRRERIRSRCLPVGWKRQIVLLRHSLGAADVASTWQGMGTMPVRRKANCRVGTYVVTTQCLGDFTPYARSGTNREVCSYTKTFWERTPMLCTGATAFTG